MYAGRPEAQAAAFARHVDRLKAGGCGAVAVTSMGGHFCIRQLEAISSLPLIDAIPALDRHFAASGLRRVGVLDSRNAMASRLYGVGSVEVMAPADEDLPTVHATYVAMAAAAEATDAQCRYLAEQGQKLHEAGAEAIVLGGTDLFLAFDGRPPPYPLIDSALVHAAAIARVAMGA